MLMLNRKIGEKVYIGDNVVITLLDIMPNGRAKLAIDVPPSMRVARGEAKGANISDNNDGHHNDNNEINAT